ncbi:MAG: histidine phosphatase family protein [Chloroflexi bacterium]|nr:histidine phosphatase family protein [Chloroflexota bacterium]
MDDPPRERPLSGDAGAPRPALIPAGLDATIVLLRHGESVWVAEGRFQGQGDSPLSPEGERQAELAAARLARPHAVPALPIPAGPPIEIRHSPLARTTATAAAVARAMASPDAMDATVPVVPDAGFLEIGQGEWEGRPASEIEARWGEVLAGWRRDPLTTWAPGGESLVAVDGRARASLATVLAALRARSAGTDVPGSQVLGYGGLPSDEPWTVVVAHDGVFKVSLLALLDLPLERFWTFPFALAGISVVEIRAGRPRLRAHNLTEHLRELETERRQALDAERSRSGAL